MKQLMSVLGLGGALILSSCATTKPYTTFTFDYEGHTARIISVSESGKTEHPYNILQVDGLRLKAIDYQQNKTVDVVQGGNLDKEEAQEIYEYGLQQALNLGQLVEKMGSRFTYEYKEEDTIYRIESYRPAGEEPFNEFTIVRPVEGLIKAVDEQANGTTDNILESSYPPNTTNDIQKEYTKTLNKGLNERKIEMLEGTYHVKPK